MNPKLIELAKRRGLFWPSFEIYGGVSGFIDFGPVGVRILRKIEEEWRRHFMLDFIYEISTPIVMPEIVFEASGHLEHFTDTVLNCSKCGKKYRVDYLIEEKGVEGWDLDRIWGYVKDKGIKCPDCGGDLDRPYRFNLLMRTTIGPYSGDVGYIRPEAAQGIFINFKRTYDLVGKKLPFGVFQIGKVGRNEISPRRGLYRMREFTIIDLEFFYDNKNPNCWLIDSIKNEKLRILRAGEKEIIEKSIEELLNREWIKSEWMAFFMKLSEDFLTSLGIERSKRYFLEKAPEERAHYSSQTFDQMVVMSDGEHVEVAGYALRTDYDLRRHSEKSKFQLVAERIEEGKVAEKFYPYVVEPSFGLERLFLVTIDAAYSEVKNRILLKLPKSIAPYSVLVAPLVRKDPLIEKASQIHENLKKEGLESLFEYSEYIGKTYAKADEIGIPYVVTIDYQTLEDDTMTIRDRDSWSQVRIDSKELARKIKYLLRGELKLEEAGVLIEKKA